MSINTAQPPVTPLYGVSSITPAGGNEDFTLFSSLPLTDTDLLSCGAS